MVIIAKDEPNKVYDLIGLGYGPAHLALSIALKESKTAEELGLSYVFLERREHFAWHPALLLPGSQLQVSPLKDLVTLRDPTSSFSFINFLHSTGRLMKYINKEQTIPSRREWTAYLAWSAERMKEVVEYGQIVVAVKPMVAHADSFREVDLESQEQVEKPDLFKVVTRKVGSDQETVRFARNISVAVGGVAKVPPAFEEIYHRWSATSSSSRLVHSSTFVPSLLTLEPILRKIEVERQGKGQGESEEAAREAKRLKLAVIGGGQSSTEMTMYLHKRFPNAIVKMIFRASALVPSDDSSFVNSAAFDPERTDEFWNASEEAREEWRREFKRTNYSVVRADLLNELNDTIYEREIELPDDLQAPDEAEAGRIVLASNTVVRKAVVEEGAAGGGYRLDLVSSKPGQASGEESFDAVFLGTGFERGPWKLDFLKPLEKLYPILNSGWKSAEREREESVEISSATSSSSSNFDEDEEDVERRRERVRGITRDYRLVSIHSPAFQNPQHVRSSSSTSSGDSTPFSTGTSSTSSSQTLASGDEEEEDDDDGKPPSIYVLGGNEATHGLSDSLLSIVAYRSGEQTRSLLERVAACTSRRASAPAALKISNKLVSNEQQEESKIKARIQEAAKSLAALTTGA
ncbi:hypothetical protein IE53DRAFT_321471 [Violaceomyces palustris]|uniref:Uncharacterized protein n=1 Tax=Violaceomyces palustris TaxID=1673888 RepID=A0ACD0NNG9_9BASI|nr:hypothetical protein IE53DRAFT_321471 [Violaceomyces palustris]